MSIPAWDNSLPQYLVVKRIRSVTSCGNYQERDGCWTSEGQAAVHGWRVPCFRYHDNDSGAACNL